MLAQSWVTYWGKRTGKRSGACFSERVDPDVGICKGEGLVGL